MPINITMPALSPTMEEGNLSKWLVKEGDKVSPGDVIAEIETDKATMEVEAVDEGTVAKLVVPAGTEGVKVNALIAVLAAEGEDAGAAAKSSGAAAPAKAEAPKVDAPKAEAPKAEAPKAEPAAAAPKAEAAPVANGHAAGERTFASPLARRIAREAGVDVSAVTGTGPHGRVVKADVDAAIAGGGAKPAAKAAPAGAPVAPSAAAPAVKAMSDDQVLKLFEAGSYDLVPHDNMRKTIARRLVEAKTTIPHFYLTLDCEL
ncbi:e3 binding domain-containing protein, partial [Mesorhizobium loti]